MPGDNQSAITVVICTYNRDKFIGAALECLARQTLTPSLFEIVVVDNNSTDNTAFISKNFITAHPELNARYVLETNRGLSFARNRGIEEAKAPIITFMDDDAEAVPGFLESILHFLKDHPTTAGIGGKVIPRYSEEKEPRWMSKYLNGYVGLLDYGNEPKRFGKGMKYPAGCNMTYSREILLKAGGFNNQLTFRSDDKFIFHQVSKLSTEIYYLPQAMLYHNIDSERLSFSSFKRLFLKTGNEEKIRVRTEKGKGAVIQKFAEFVFKSGAAALIWLLFALKGQAIKGRYVFLSQWFTLKGFCKKEVFVR